MHGAAPNPSSTGGAPCSGLPATPSAGSSHSIPNSQPLQSCTTVHSTGRDLQFSTRQAPIPSFRRRPPSDPPNPSSAVPPPQGSNSTPRRIDGHSSRIQFSAPVLGAQSDRSAHLSMAIKMKDKYEKYWGDPEKMNKYIFIAAILDPRTKESHLFKDLLEGTYGSNKGKAILSATHNEFVSLFREYKQLYGAPSTSSELTSKSETSQNATENSLMR